MKYSVITLFPTMFDSYVHESMLKRAQEKGLISFQFVNPREFASDKHGTVDDTPYGGGPGMVMKAEPILHAVSSLDTAKRKKIIFFTPGGVQFTNEKARAYAQEFDELIFICGRYEGVDARVKEVLLHEYTAETFEEVSIGPYVLTGGELPAMVIIDAVSRQIKGVLGNECSPEENRTSSTYTYTKPDSIIWNEREYSVPEILISGHHAKIEEWRRLHQKGSQ